MLVPFYAKKHIEREQAKRDVVSWNEHMMSE